MNNNCDFCHRPGARWQLKVDGESLPVHRGCGRLLAAMAPKGQAVKLGPSPSLREEWARAAAEKAARDFWAEKFRAAGLEIPAAATKASATPVAGNGDRTEELVDQLLRSLKFPVKA